MEGIKYTTKFKKNVKNENVCVMYMYGKELKRQVR